MEGRRPYVSSRLSTKVRGNISVCDLFKIFYHLSFTDSDGSREKPFFWGGGGRYNFMPSASMSMQK